MESISIRLPPQFLPGSDTILTDSLSRPHQLPHPEWYIHMTVFLFLRRLWPVQMVSLPPRPLIVVRFTSPLSGIRSQQARTRFSSSGTAFRLPRSIRWLSSEYYREAPGLHGDGTHSCDSPLGSAPLVFGPGPALAGSSSDPTVPSRPPALDSVSSSLPGSQLAQASCLATLQRFPKAAGFSSAIVEQSSLARRPSSRAVYQVRWSIYHRWCHSNGHSNLCYVSRFLCYLRYTKGLGVSSLRGYRSVLSAVFCFHLPSLSSDQVLQILLRSFQLSSAECVLRPHTWDLSMVLPI